jgi:tRNA threonylcarbamoyladenosine biosynthesis protein TsaB
MILVLQTADQTTRLWLLDSASSPVGEPTLTWDSGRELSDKLLGVLVGELHKVHHRLGDLSGIVIFSGPGSFTSLRIGHTTANALADSLGIPVVGARGADWMRVGLKDLSTAKPGRPALPHYGSEAHITRPKG